MNTKIHSLNFNFADPRGRAGYGIGLRPMTGWDCGFESRWGSSMCLLWVLCVVRLESLRRADPSYRGVLQ